MLKKIFFFLLVSFCFANTSYAAESRRPLWGEDSGIVAKEKLQVEMGYVGTFFKGGEGKKGGSTHAGQIFGRMGIGWEIETRLLFEGPILGYKQKNGLALGNLQPGIKFLLTEKAHEDFDIAFAADLNIPTGDSASMNTQSDDMNIFSRAIISYREDGFRAYANSGINLFLRDSKFNIPLYLGTSYRFGSPKIKLFFEQTVKVLGEDKNSLPPQTSFGFSYWSKMEFLEKELEWDFSFSDSFLSKKTENYPSFLQIGLTMNPIVKIKLKAPKKIKKDS